MFQPQHQGQEDARVAMIDDRMQGVILKLRVMSRAAAKDRPRYRAEIREGLQDVVDRCMAFADALSR